jgi:choline dehydrogenase-like flavoprotein
VISDPRQNTSMRADVCIVGAGLAGIYCAIALRSLGASVLVVEAGPRTAIFGDPESITFREDRYEGAIEGRALGLGGTSTLWGGQLAPLAPHELLGRLTNQPEAWPFDAHALQAAYPAVCERFDLSRSAYESLATRTSTYPLGFAEGTALSLKIGKRNVANLWRRQLKYDDHLNVLLNCEPRAARFSGSGGGRRIESLDIATRDGGTLKVAADSFIIACGALASTCLYQRIFTELRTEAGFRAGTTLQDHLSVPIARVVVRDAKSFRDHFSPRLTRDGIAFRRLFSTEAFEAATGGPGGFMHIVYKSDSGLPNWLHVGQSLAQRNKWRALSKHMVKGARHAGSLMEMATAAVKRRRVEWPRDTCFELLLDIEQLPDARNAVSWHDSRMAIRWKRREADAEIHRQVKEKILSSWPSSIYGTIAQLVPGADQELNNARVAYHPTGTLRMSRDVRNGIVDGDCRMHGAVNGFIVSTAVFPRCGAGNPSFTLLALSERLSRHLSGRRT